MGQMDHGMFDMTMGQARTGPLRELTGLALGELGDVTKGKARPGNGWASPCPHQSQDAHCFPHTNPVWDQSGLAIWDRSHYQSKVFVCVSVVMGRIRITARMRSIGF